MNLKWSASDKNKVAPVIMSHKSCLFNFLIVSWDIAMEMKIQRGIHRANTTWLISLVSWGNKTKMKTPVMFNFLGLLPLTVTKKKKKKREREREFLQLRQACRLSCKFNWPVALDLIQPLGSLEHSSQNVCVIFLALPPLFNSFKSKTL